ncbi:MAG: hypothetical protein E7097_03200 [Bacteroides sp.]|nr:hypothetical protein [Bacteroides sp.]
MSEIIKHINDTNASYRSLTAGDAKNTDLFFDQGHYSFFGGINRTIKVRLHKTNLSQSILFIASILPRKYDLGAKHYRVEYSSKFVEENLAVLDSFFTVDGVKTENRVVEWNVRKDIMQKNGKIDDRLYLNGLQFDLSYDFNGNQLTTKFSIRNYLAGGYSNVRMISNVDDIYDFYISNVTEAYFEDDGIVEEIEVKQINLNNARQQIYRPYITAIKSKPFLLLAGISGTGKSRIVRELARACWEADSEEYKAQKPKNFVMIQVKPNWHDSSELIGYVSRVSGEPVYVTGDFLKFIAKAWENLDVPHFLCLDEMNLAPVEQYFAEYLSVIESRKNKNGEIVTDAIIEKCAEQWFYDLTAKLTTNDDVRTRFMNEGITIPKNLIVVGTVNMDETTFSFSRKVLDRAMTIEMNEVDLEGGLDKKYESIGRLGEAELIGYAVEGVDVYADNKEVCDTAISYLKAINEKLEGTPFKVAYRTRNEFLLYVVNNLPYNKNENGEDIPQEMVIARALDEITNMKILSRIEGDETKVSERFLNDLRETIKKELNKISQKEYSGTKGKEGTEYAVSLAKLKEMATRLGSGYTSFWS